MVRLLGFLGARATWVLFLGVFIGLLFPFLSSLMRPLLGPAVAALLFATLLRIDWGALAEHARRPLITLVLTAWLLLASPVLVWLVLLPVPLPQSLAHALILMAAAPPILSAAAIAIQLGLDGALAILVVSGCTLLAPLTVPPLAFGLVGMDLQVGLLEFIVRLATIVIGAFLGAAVVRKFVGRAQLAAKAKQIDGCIVIIMLIFAIAIMEGVTETLLSQPETVLIWVAAAFLSNPLLQIIGIFTFRWMGRRKALTVGLMTGNANMGLLLASLPPDTDSGVSLYFAVGQLPVYMLPAILLPLYRSFLRGA